MNNDLDRLIKICGKSYRRAKRWYRGYIYWQAAALLFALSSFALDYGAKISALVTLLGVAVSEFYRWRSDEWKSKGDWAKRRLEAADGLGKSVDKEEIANWLVDSPENFLDNITDDETRGSEFASNQPPGPRRAVENTKESAWWSKSLCSKMVLYLTVALVVFAICGVTALAVSICELKSVDTQKSVAVVQTVGCVICSVWAFIFSINALRLLFDYYAFARKTDEVLNRCAILLKTQNLSEREACDVMNDYQTARSSAPLIPDFVWRRHKNHLNKLWDEFLKV